MHSGSNPVSEQIRSKEVRLIWATFAEPIFDIVVSRLHGQSEPQIVSSRDVSVTLRIENYRLGDPRL